MSRSVRSALNFLMATVSTGVGVLTSFIATPFILRWLGEDRFGAFRVSMDWLGYLSLLELGTGAALAPLILKAHAERNDAEEQALLAAGLRRYLRVALLTALVGGVLVAVLPFLTKIPPALENELRVGAALYLVVICGSYPFAIYRPFAEATQRNYLISLLLIVQGTITALMCVGLAYGGYGIIGQFIGTGVGTLAFAIGLSMVLPCTVSWKQVLKPEAFTEKASLRLLPLSRLSLIQTIIGRICLMTDNIVISFFGGPRAVASFYLTQVVLRMATTVLQAFGVSTWAGLCELYQQGQQDQFQRRLNQLTIITASLGAIVIAPLVSLAKPFVHLWVGEEQYAGDAVVIVAGINSYLLPIFTLWGYVFTGTGRVGVLIPSGLGSAFANLALSISITWYAGIIGPLLGTAVVYVFYTWWKLPQLLRLHFRVPMQQLIINSLKPFVIAIVICSLHLHFREKYFSYSWHRIVAEYFCYFSLTTAIIWYSCINYDDRKDYRSLVSHLLFRR